MSFVQERFNRSFLQTQGIFNEYAYNPGNGDALSDVESAGYFNQSRFIGEDGWVGGIVLCNLADGFFTLQIQEDGASAVVVDIAIPTGGSTGQALIKLSPADYDIGWGAGSTDFIPGKTVNNFAALPSAATWADYLAICVNSQGVWLINYKAAGIYYSDGANWIYQGDYELTEQASEIENTPAGTVTATNVQSAINELDTNKIAANVAITGATKTKITYDAKGLVTSGADATTADIADSLNRRYVTDAQLVVIGNTSGVNTGDQNLTPYFNKTVDDTDDITEGTANKFATASEKTKLGFITVTQAVDLDTIESDTIANNAKVTNATHTGEVTGSGGLTLDKTAISNRSTVAVAATDTVLFGDTSNADALAKCTVQDIVNLSGAITLGKSIGIASQYLALN